MPLALGAARLAELTAAARRKEPALTRYAVLTLAYSQTFDLTRARTLLDWRPRYSPEQAIADALARKVVPCAS